MALIDPTKVTRFDIPNEPDHWVELRSLMGGDVIDASKMTPAATAAERTHLLLSFCVKAWSYEAAVSADSLKMVDVDTYNWLAGLMYELTDGRSDDEKKDSTSPSSPPPAPARAGSRRNSGT